MNLLLDYHFLFFLFYQFFCSIYRKRDFLKKSCNYCYRRFFDEWANDYFWPSSQYQSVVIFCILLSIYLYHTGVKRMEYRFFIFSGVIFGIGLLAHLDILGSVFFFLGYFLFELKNKKFIKFKIFSNFLFFLSATAVSSLFYVFYFFSHFDEKKQDYLQNRVFGSGFMPQTPYMNLGKILTLYMPDFYWIILFCFCVLSLALLFSKYKSKDKNMNKLFILVLFLFTFAFMFSFFPIKPRLSSLLIYLSSFLLILFSFFSRIKSVIFALIFYFLFSFSIYFYFMKDPRTHVYICLLPAFILFSYGVYFFIEHKSKFIKATSQVFFILYFTFLSLVGYLMFFDKNSEYPLEQKANWLQLKIHR